MTPEENKVIARRFFEEVWNQRNLDAIEEIFAPQVLLNGQTRHPADITQLITRMLAAFPDIHVTVEDQVAEGDKVSTRRTWRGTHHGEWLSPLGKIPPTGKQATWVQIS